MVATDRKNKFCKLDNLANESDVEQFFILPLLRDIGYSPDQIATKMTIQEASIGKGAKSKKNYQPDYVLYLDNERKKPVVIIDAKHPHEQAEEGVTDSQLYASVMRRDLTDPKPDQYCIGSNGKTTIVKHHDSNVELFKLAFQSFKTATIHTSDSSLFWQENHYKKFTNPNRNPYFRLRLSSNYANPQSMKSRRYFSNAMI